MLFITSLLNQILPDFVDIWKNFSKFRGTPVSVWTLRENELARNKIAKTVHSSIKNFWSYQIRTLFKNIFLLFSFENFTIYVCSGILRVTCVLQLVWVYIRINSLYALLIMKGHKYGKWLLSCLCKYSTTGYKYMRIESGRHTLN